jgi:hypothetical protein
MPGLLFYPALTGTFLSVSLLSCLAWKEHNSELPRTLSQLAAQNKKLVNYFRVVLWTCGTLFAITMFGYIIPRVLHSGLQLIAWVVYYVCELLLALFPARGTIEKQLHSIFSYSMGAAMLATAFLFIVNVHGVHARIEVGITCSMAILAMLTLLDKKRFIFYELPFIYLSHASILVAAIALQ